MAAPAQDFISSSSPPHRRQDNGSNSAPIAAAAAAAAASCYLQHQQFLSVINKVASWIASSDRHVCLFADDKSLSTLSPSVLSETGELERVALTEQLQREAIERANVHNRPHINSERQVNNHHNTDRTAKRASARRRRARTAGNVGGKTDADEAAAAEVEEASEVAVADPRLEEVIQRASDEIRSVVYRLREQRRLPGRCRLSMRLSIEQRHGGQQQQRQQQRQSKRRSLHRNNNMNNNTNVAH